MLKKVSNYINEHNLLSAGDKVIVGVSGGPDSVCLLDILYRLSDDMNIKLAAVHVNHGIRGAEADRDEEFVKAYCEEKNIELHVFHKDVREIAKKMGQSEEEAGRNVRYEAFDLVDGNAKIAVAHHMDDQAETVLHHIVRGSSLKGACGMLPRNGRIIRPLLCVSKKEIEEYLANEDLQFCIDSTNLSDHYTRNKFRNVVLPYMRDNFNPNVSANIAEFANDMQDYYSFIESETQKAWNEVCESESDDNVTLSVSMLKDVHVCIRREIYMRAIRFLINGCKDITRIHLEDIDSLLFNRVSKKIVLPYKLLALRGYETLVIRKNDLITHKEKQDDFMSCMEEDFEFEVLPYKENCEKLTNDYTKVFDYDKIKDKLKLRKRQPGDYFTIDGMGNKKSLKSFFIDKKIPREDRDCIWLLAEGSHVLWIVGYRISEAYKVDNNTKRILQVTLGRK